MDGLDAGVFSGGGPFLICSSTPGRATCPTTPGTVRVAQDRASRSQCIWRDALGGGPTPKPSATAASVSDAPELGASVSARSCSTTRARARCRRNRCRVGRRLFCNVKSPTHRLSRSKRDRRRALAQRRRPLGQPAKIHIPRDYNAAYDLIERNLSAGRAGRSHRQTTPAGGGFRRTAERRRLVGAFRRWPEMEDRALALTDTIEPDRFLGAIKAGIIPVAVNTPLTPKDYEATPRQRRGARRSALRRSPRRCPGFRS